MSSLASLDVEGLNSWLVEEKFWSKLLSWPILWSRVQMSEESIPAKELGVGVEVGVGVGVDVVVVNELGFEFLVVLVMLAEYLWRNSVCSETALKSLH